MPQGVADEAGVSPVLATLLLVAVVVTASAVVAVLAGGFRDTAERNAPALGLVTETDRTQRDGWTLRVTTSLPPTPWDRFQVFLRTPANGTLVATPTDAASLDFYWSLGASAGTGVHRDNGTTVGDHGGFHLRLVDTDSDGRLGGGDRFHLWYDGDGSQGHQGGKDDPLPGGTYGFELKHVRTQSYVGLETQQF